MGSPTVNRCLFLANLAEYGAGMCNWVDSNPTVTNCTFAGNAAEYAGGGMHNEYSSLTVVSCTFIGNWFWTGGGAGGGMVNIAGSPTVANCLFAANAGPSTAAMANWQGGNPSVTNCTFTGNAIGGMWSGGNSYPVVSNCIFWDNGGEEIVNVSDSTATVSYSAVEGGYPGAGNIDAEPLFAQEPDSECCIPHDTPGCSDSTCEAVVCAADPFCCNQEWEGICAAEAASLCGDLCLRDLHLSPGSPCIDAGDNAAVPPDQFDLDGDGDTTEPIPYDLDGNPRFHDDPGTPDTGNPDGVNPLVDMGAYEFQGTSPSCPWDCGGDKDNNIGIVDFLALLGNWG